MADGWFSFLLVSFVFCYFVYLLGVLFNSVGMFTRNFNGLMCYVWRFACLIGFDCCLFCLDLRFIGWLLWVLVSVFD